MHKITVEKFEGPLDLLLSLIEDQQLSITDISLAQVTEQFLNYIKDLEQVDPTAMADYLTIAAKLLVIKSKAILPSLEIETEDEDPGEDLTEKLLIYKQFKEASKSLRELDDNRRQSFTRGLVFSQKINFFPDPNITTNILHSAILKVVQSLKELDNLPKAKVREAISIQEKINHLKTILSGKIQTKLSDLIANAKNKDEAIITFLALLELIKQKTFSVEQTGLFSEVTITRYEATISSEEIKPDESFNT